MSKEGEITYTVKTKGKGGQPIEVTIIQTDPKKAGEVVKLTTTSGTQPK